MAKLSVLILVVFCLASLLQVCDGKKKKQRCKRDADCKILGPQFMCLGRPGKKTFCRYCRCDDLSLCRFDKHGVFCLCPTCEIPQRDSCRDLKMKNPSVSNGEYFMRNGYGQTYIVYCEFHEDHGYMFIPKTTTVPINIAKLDPSTSGALVRHRRSNGQQYDTFMEQMSGKSKFPLSIQYNQNINYSRPQNYAKLAPYLYLGFLPITDAKQRSSQGYRANGKDFTFRNCDANPNSYLAFFFNSQNGNPTDYHKRCCYTNLMRNWINVGTPAFNYLPENYFCPFEMHMGGCGGYAIEGYSTLDDITGAVLGMRFEL